jgi:hypothetical protein
MLNKAICKQCFKIHYFEEGWWDDNDEYLWTERDEVLCPKRNQDEGRDYSPE